MADSPIKVLFMHGLESRPNGTKTRMLRAQGFEVHAADMHMSVLQVRRRNSIVRHVLRLVEMQVWLAAIGLGLSVGATTGQVGIVLGTLGLALVWGLARWRSITARGVAASFAGCVAIQAAAVRRVSPDLVVGSSWGGAVATQVMLEGAWRGPTILLAPAFVRLWAWAGRSDVEPQLEALRGCLVAPMVVFHDPADEVVPHADSVAMLEQVGEGLELRTVDAGGHRLLGLLERGELAETIHELLARAH